MTKYILYLLFITNVLNLSAQTLTPRYFNRANFPPSGQGHNFGDFNRVIRTGDKGYIFTYFPYSPSISFPSYTDRVLIKTDSNFVPQWNYEAYCRPIKVSNSSVLLTRDSLVQMITNSGTVIWSKKLTGNFYLFDAEVYNNKIRLVGSICPTSFCTFCLDPSSSISIEMDTLGNVLSSVECNPSAIGSLKQFDQVLRDSLGNFYVAPDWTNNIILKYSPSFNLLWAKSLNSSISYPEQVKLTLVSNKEFVLTCMLKNPSTSLSGFSIARFDSSGNFLSAKRFSSSGNNAALYGITRFTDGNFCGSYYLSNSSIAPESHFVFKLDKNLNVLWSKQTIDIQSAGSPFELSSKRILFPIIRYKPGILILDSLGNSNCGTLNTNFPLISYSITATTISLPNPSIKSYTIQQSNGYTPIPITFYDSCQVVGLKEYHLGRTNFSIYPSPANETITVTIAESDYNEKFTLIVRDLLGNVVMEEDRYTNGNILSVPVINLGNGYYTISLINSKGFAFSKPFIISH